MILNASIITKPAVTMINVITASMNAITGTSASMNVNIMHTGIMTDIIQIRAIIASTGTIIADTAMPIMIVIIANIIMPGIIITDTIGMVTGIIPSTHTGSGIISRRTTLWVTPIMTNATVAGILRIPATCMISGTTDY